MASSPSLVTLGPRRAPLQCLVCEGSLFADQEIKLNTSGMEFLGAEWADRSGTALICDRCGFVHTFAGSEFELWDPSGGYPG
jgi:hypothetical protein